MNNKIATVIVTYNGEKWIRKCLSSIKASSQKTDIIIVDNNSKDRTIDIIKSSFFDVTLLVQEENLGFGRANNIGISYALQKKANYIFLLNQDTWIRTDTIKELLHASQLSPKFGIVSPIHLNWSGDQLEYYFSKFIGVSRIFLRDILMNENRARPYEIPFINAAAWFMPAEVFRIIGGFDPIFYHYGEDNNFCQRLIFHDLKIGFIPNAFIYHDSQKREISEDYLFSDAYYDHEFRNILVEYANINTEFGRSNISSINLHNIRLILISLLKFNFQHAVGYFKKYKLIASCMKSIEKSRSINELKGSHYLEL